MRSRKDIFKILKEESDWIFILVTILLFLYMSRHYQPKAIEPKNQEIIDTLEK